MYVIFLSQNNTNNHIPFSIKLSAKSTSRKKKKTAFVCPLETMVCS